MANKNEKLSYSKAYAEIEEILKGIEEEEINMDVLIEKVKRASYLIKYCKDKLKNTETEVKKVFEDIDKEF